MNSWKPKTYPKNPQPYWHCGVRSVRVDGDFDPGGVYSGMPLAMECPCCKARANWVPIVNGIGNLDFGWGLWESPREGN